MSAPNSGAGTSSGGFAVELHRVRDERELAATAVVDRLHEAVRLRLRVDGEVGHAVDDVPLPGLGGQERLPLVQRLRRERLVELGDALRAVRRRAPDRSAKRSSSIRSLRPIAMQKSAQYTSGCSMQSAIQRPSDVS